MSLVTESSQTRPKRVIKKKLAFDEIEDSKNPMVPIDDDPGGHKAGSALYLETIFNPDYAMDDPDGSVSGAIIKRLSEKQANK